MLQELAARTGASAWAIASMLFFIAVYLVVAVRVMTTRREVLDAQARLALEGEGGSLAEVPSGAGTQA